jgi:hypothetical protein
MMLLAWVVTFGCSFRSISHARRSTSHAREMADYAVSAAESALVRRARAIRA